MSNRIFLAAGLACLASPTLGTAHLARSSPAASLSAVTLPAMERRALADAAVPGLADLRGGSEASGALITEAESRALRLAQQKSPELAALRGGDLHLDNRDLTLIGITALAVIVLVWVL